MADEGREPRTPTDAPDEVVRKAVAAWGGEPGRFTELLGELDGCEDAARVAVDDQFALALSELWRRGWTPRDLVHALGRRATRGHVAVAIEQILADGRRTQDRGERLHPRWRKELAELDAARGAAVDLTATRHLRLGLEVLALITCLPAVTRTIPAPGSRWSTTSSTSHLDPRVLGRVRALLAKAESTTFEAEAEAFTAKAQELIARHAIDEALLHDASDVGEPAVRRLLVDDPYAAAKAYLVHVVADANHCRSVETRVLGWVTVFGYDRELDAVELLVASLLAQATAAMVRQGSKRDLDGRSVTRSFRRAFLLGFAERVGERLRRAAQEQVSATDDRRLLPVLAVRDERIRAAQAAAFPHVVRTGPSLSNTAGWHAGRAAAEVADLRAP